jgi:4-alpha-glucanotransferase
MRLAAVLIPLFSLRTGEDLGRGEILDLIPFIDFASAMGHRVVQLLPLGETAPEEASPYSALSVFAIDPLYISVASLRGLGDRIEVAREAIGGIRTVPRDRLRGTKLPLLTDAYHHFRTRAGWRQREQLDGFIAQHKGWLPDYALFRALKERFSWANWEEWPADLRARNPLAVEAARRQLGPAIRMYCYWQYLAHRQWLAVRSHARRSGMMIGGDLSFSPARDSAEVWANQHLFRMDRLVGTPPDAFSAKGQRWGLPMPDWPRMRAANFAWWRMRIRHAHSLFDLFRIDHVVGLYRTFSFGANADEPGCFFPENESAQREQGEAFMRMAIEEAGVEALIAEDLGTVPPWVRASLTAHGVPGFKVVRWEKENWGTPKECFVAPRTYPELSVATTGTHDTESFADWWRDAPFAERRKMVTAFALDGRVDARRRYLDLAGMSAILETVYAAPSQLVIAPIQDLFGWTARINLPGTVSARNWAWRLPMPIERLRQSPAIQKRLGVLRTIAVRTGRFVPVTS